VKVKKPLSWKTGGKTIKPRIDGFGDMHYNIGHVF
jgi:hypothetical protein